MEIANWKLQNKGLRRSSFCNLQFAICILQFLLLLVSVAPIVRAEPPPFDLTTPTPLAVSEKPFEDALTRELSVQWQKVPLRQALRHISETANIAILLDRRLDPDREVNLEVSDEPVLKIIERASRDQSAVVRRVGSVIYIGPERSGAILRTLVALRRSELKNAAIPAHRQQKLTHHETLAWGDLAEPTKLLERAGKLFALKISAENSLPHDLLGRAPLANVNAPEMLSLLLIQFDRTFEWNSDGSGIRLTPIPNQVVITQPHAPPRGKTAAQAAAEWRGLLPNVPFTTRPGEILVTATIEQHELLGQSKAHTDTRPDKTPGLKSVDLSRERFTLQGVREVPLNSLIEKLSSPKGAGLTFQYDEEELKRAGARLDQRISLDVKSVPMQTLLQAALENTDLSFELKGKTVRLFPKPKPAGGKN